jgi:hypothetical protein
MCELFFIPCFIVMSMSFGNRLDPINQMLREQFTCGNMGKHTGALRQLEWR